MPCRTDDYGPSRESVIAPAILCAILSTFTETQLFRVLDKVDWKEAGVTRREFDAWWAAHLETDRKRREQEQFMAKRDSLRKSAASKLTAAERRALGL